MPVRPRLAQGCGCLWLVLCLGTAWARRHDLGAKQQWLAFLPQHHQAYGPLARHLASQAAAGVQRRHAMSPTALRMRVDVDVKERPAPSSSSNNPSDAVKMRPQDDAAALPPIIRDSFKHPSMASKLPTEYPPYAKAGKFKINAFGVWFLFCAILAATPWAFILAVQVAFIDFFDKFDSKRYHVDAPCRWWARSLINMGFSFPDLTGLENIPEGPVVFVANHASWMDVPYASLVSQKCKYMAKSDLLKVPVLGQSMALSNHVMIDRQDKRSQMEAMVKANVILRGGTSLFVFPEGTRGKEGRLGEFKSGAFRLAVKAGTPIVPISMAGTHLVMPKSVLMPHRPGKGVTTVHVHPAIPSKGRTDKELMEIAFDIINDALPPEQQHIKPPVEALPSTSTATITTTTTTTDATHQP